MSKAPRRGCRQLAKSATPWMGATASRVAADQVMAARAGRARGGGAECAGVATARCLREGARRLTASSIRTAAARAIAPRSRGVLTSTTSLARGPAARLSSATDGLVFFWLVVGAAWAVGPRLGRTSRRMESLAIGPT